MQLWAQILTEHLCLSVLLELCQADIYRQPADKTRRMLIRDAADIQMGSINEKAKAVEFKQFNPEGWEHALFIIICLLSSNMLKCFTEAVHGGTFHSLKTTLPLSENTHMVTHRRRNQASGITCWY